MIERIKEYKGKLGTIVVERYSDKEWHVRYDAFSMANAWYDNKAGAIAYAQFLAGAY